MYYDVLDGVPCKVLGYGIKTRTQIVLSCILPAFLELNIYVLLVFTDIAVAYQHYQEGNFDYGLLTVIFLCLPAVVCFVGIVSSPGQWPTSDSWSAEHTHFLFKQIINMLLFPMGAMYRFCRRIFWGIEALFHDKHTCDRLHAVSKAAEYSPLELYHFIQAFFHAAPQLILQLNLLLRGNLFRNFETATVQAMSVILCFITMATIITTYQRFESQKIVGRNYPWCSIQQVQENQRQFRRSRSLPAEVIKKQSVMPEYPDVLSNFKSRYSETNNERASLVSSNSSPRKTLNVNQYNFNDNYDYDKNAQTDDEKMGEKMAYDEIDRPTTSKSVRISVPFNRGHSTTSNNLPDEDLVRNYHEIKRFLVNDDFEFYEEDEFEPPADSPVELRPRIHSDNFDQIPSVPPPPPPPNTAQTGFFDFPARFKRMSTYKDMLVQNTKHFIHDHVPRLPEKYFPDEEKEPEVKPDEVDLVLPSGRKIFEGIEQDDVIGKTVSFLGWMLFLVMRMLTLSVFSVFYPETCVVVILCHYLIMLVCIFWEIKFHEKIERLFFYCFLSSVYIFTLLEFKIKFRGVRRWYCGYIAFVFVQNLVLTFIWYAVGSSDSWWFHFLFMVIIGSGVLSLMCLMFYFILLKPPNKILVENTTGNNLN